VTSLPSNWQAIVLGATGALGGAFVEVLRAAPGAHRILAFGRSSQHSFTLEDENSIAALAREAAPDGPYHLVIDATGALEIDGVGPEKRLDQLDAQRLARAFQVNSIGPALLLKHFVPLLPTTGRSIFATLSARVGSIGENEKGGWYGYRASKAARNMLLQTAAIEACRRRPEAVFLALQPGTVRSRLSAPYITDGTALLPADAAGRLLEVMDQSPATRKAAFLDHRGQKVGW